MKFVLIINDESWFWVYNVETQYWEAWYEGSDGQALRLTNLDRTVTTGVAQMMGDMAIAAQMAHAATIA